MSDELVSILARFHRTVVLPDIERVVAERVASVVNPRFDAIDGHLDAIYKRLERLETEYEAIKVGVGRVEKRLDSVEQRLEGLEQRVGVLEAGYRDLLASVHRLDERLSRVEKRLDELVDPNWHAVLRSEVQHLRTRLDGLQARVDALEKDAEP